MSRREAVSPRAADMLPDPFRERTGGLERFEAVVLGGRFVFESESQVLLDLARAAFGGVPEHRLSRVAPTFSVRLVANGGATHTGRGTTAARGNSRGAATSSTAVASSVGATSSAGEASDTHPPLLEMFSGAGFLCGIDPAATGVFVDAERRCALVIVSSDRLRSGYHTRYELIEFAVYTLATRSLGLIPLHAACVSERGRGALIVGPSGSGKSTLALHSLLGGLDFVSEDSVLVAPTQLAVTGVPNFMHLRRDGLVLIDNAADRTTIARSPVIQRRSGVRKFEVDMRQSNYPLAARPPRLATVIFPSAERAPNSSKLTTRLSHSEVAKRLRESQPYATLMPGWREFLTRLRSVRAYELRRGSHPREGVDALHALLAAS